MYVASSPRAELVNLDNLSVPLLRIAFLRASARACANDIVLVVTVMEDERERMDWNWNCRKHMYSITMMSCLLSEDAEEFESPTERGIGATWLAGLSDPFLLFCPTSSATKSPLRPCRRVDPPTSSVQVYLELLTDNAAAGREAEEMLKTGFQCVSVSVTPGLVPNGPLSSMVLTRRV